MSACYVWLSRAELMRHEACPAGLALFDSIARIQGRREKIRVLWTPLTCVWLSTSYLNWLWEHGLVPMCSLRDANLRGANLDGADLGGANLLGAYLDGANLRNANLDGAKLYGADLRGAYLGNADLRGANLDGARLDGPDLFGANISGANLDGAYIGGADPVPAGWVRDAYGHLSWAVAP